MQQSIQLETVIDDDLIQHIPKISPFLGHRVQLIAIDMETKESAEQRLSFDDFVKHRLKRPEGVPPVTLEDMEEAIIQGALDGNI